MILDDIDLVIQNLENELCDVDSFLEIIVHDLSDVKLALEDVLSKVGYDYPELLIKYRHFV